MNPEITLRMCISVRTPAVPGDSHIQWDEVFSTLAAAGYNGWLTIEAFSREDVNFADSINVWREYSKAWDVAERGLANIRECK